MHPTPDGDRLYVGVQSIPVSLHASTDWGETWNELGAFPDSPDLTRYAPQQDAMVEILLEAAWFRGESHDTYWYSLLRKE